MGTSSAGGGFGITSSPDVVAVRIDHPRPHRTVEWLGEQAGNARKLADLLEGEAEAKEIRHPIATTPDKPAPPDSSEVSTGCNESRDAGLG